LETLVVDWQDRASRRAYQRRYYAERRELWADRYKSRDKEKIRAAKRLWYSKHKAERSAVINVIAVLAY
jgi:hypothetical protein